MLPPGDLRMALAALAGSSPDRVAWAELLQHRLGGTGVLAGHPVGNIVLTGLLEREPDPVVALGAARPPGRRGRAGAADEPRPARPDRARRTASTRTIRSAAAPIRGQSSIAATPGRVVSVSLLPPGAPACAAAVDAVREADVVVLGPGSWFTSVLPHLLLRELGKTLASTNARLIVVLNLVPQAGETDDYAPHELLRAAAGPRRAVRRPAHRHRAGRRGVDPRSAGTSPLRRRAGRAISYCLDSPRTTASSGTTRCD